MRYTWQNADSAIPEVVISGDGKKEVREALIFAPADFAANPRLADLDRYLVKKGATVSYDVIDGRAALRVTNFGRENELIEALSSQGFVSGEFQTTSTAGKEQSNTEWAKENSLVLSAFFYMLGNISAVLSGWFRRDPDELRTGAAFIVGDSTMLLFGKLNDREKSQKIMSGFSEILERNGYVTAIGSSFSPAANSQETSGWGKIRHFMNDKVIAVKSLSEMTAGFSFARAGARQNNMFKTAAGTAIASGFAIGLLTPEKNKAQIQEELGTNSAEETSRKISSLPFLQRLTYRLQQNPLMIPGSFAASNNVLTLIGAADERKHQRKRAEVQARLEGGSYKVFGRGEPYVIPAAESAHSKYAAAKSAYESASGAARLEAQDNYLDAKKNLDSLQQQQKNLFTGRKFLGKEIDGKNFWMFNVAQGLFFLVANSFYAISSKSGGKSLRQENLKNRFFTSAATEALRTEDEMQRVEILNLAAKYASNLHDFNLTAKDARTLIEQRMAALQANPWMQQERQRMAAANVVELPITLELPAAMTEKSAPAQGNPAHHPHPTEPSAAAENAAKPDHAPHPARGAHPHPHLPVEGIPLAPQAQPAVAENLEAKIAKIAASREQAQQNFSNRLHTPAADWRGKSEIAEAAQQAVAL